MTRKEWLARKALFTALEAQHKLRIGRRPKWTLDDYGMEWRKSANYRWWRWHNEWEWVLYKEFYDVIQGEGPPE